MRMLIVVSMCALLGSTLTGCRDKAPQANTLSVIGPAKVQVAALAEGFRPADIYVKQGQPLELIFKRTTDDTCATEVVFKALAIKKDLPLGQAISVTIPTATRGEYTFTCGMGMH